MNLALDVIRSTSESKQHEDGAMQAHHVLAGEPPDALSDRGPPHCGDLVDHEAADIVQTC
jgi:hypothetical protein